MFINPDTSTGMPNRTKLFADKGMADVPVWGLISEDVLTNEAVLPEGPWPHAVQLSRCARPVRPSAPPNVPSGHALGDAVPTPQ